MKKFLINTSTVILSIIISAALLSCDQDEKHKNVRGCICMYTDNQGHLLYNCGTEEFGFSSLGKVNAIIYPNPAHKYVEVYFYTDGEHIITIKKKIGKVMFQQTTGNNPIYIDISSFPDGNYVLFVEDEKQISKLCLFKEER